MKDQMCETKLDVWANLFHVLTWIARDKPSTMSLVSNGCSPSLHLTWVMDSDLVFGRKGQRCPDARVDQRPLMIGIKRNFDLNRAFDGRRITACRLRSLLDCWKELILVELLSLPRGTDKAISSPASEFCRD